MDRRRWGGVLVVAAVGLAAVACDSGASGTATSGPSASNGIPASVQADRSGWPLPNRDYANTRATTDSPIDQATVSSLAVAWKAVLPGAGTFGNASTSPVVSGTTAFVEDLDAKVLAVDLRTGHVKWTADVSDGDGQPQIGPNGAVVADGKVFAVAGRGSVVALDAGSGQVLWQTTVTSTPTLGIDIQPTVYAGKVFVSTVPISLAGIYHGGDRGEIVALEADDGHTDWTFDTVDSKDLWGDPAHNSGGGAWYPPAIDPSSGVMYWGIGNPAPFPGPASAPNGSSRPGPDLYTDSTLALDASTGHLRWYQQASPHDLFDHDHQITMVATTPSGPILIGTGKDGFVYGLDPTTGHVRWKRSVGLHLHDGLTAIHGPTVVAPGVLGGVETPPATASGVVYLAVVNEPTTYTAGDMELNGTTGTRDGEVVALDASTGAVRWDVEVPGDPFGGATVVNDVVFTGLQSGLLLGLSTRDGHRVWSYKSSGVVNAWPSVVGDQLVWPLGGTTPATLVAFRLRRTS